MRAANGGTMPMSDSAELDYLDIPENVSQPVRDYLREIRGIPKSSYKNKKSVAKRFDRWVRERGADDILDAGPRDVRDWLVERHESGCKGCTVHSYHNALRSFYDEFTDTDDDETSMLPSPLDENPARFTLDNYLDASDKPVKQQVADNNEGVIYLSPSEVRDLRRHVPAPEVRNELIVKILVQTGLRRGELAEVERQHLDRGDSEITVTAEMSKTDEARTVPYDSLDPELSLWLDGGYRNRHPDAEDSPYLLLNRQSPKLSPPRISTIVREAAENADMGEAYAHTVDGSKRRRVSAHALRSTFIMRLLEAGIPTPKVMELPGHKNLKTVESYANVLKSDAIDAYHQADINFGG